MARFIELKTISDKRGHLTVIEKIIPFEIKRVFYIYGVDASVRGKHRHHTTIQAAVCVAGKCKIRNNDGEKQEVFDLDRPDKMLMLEPRDFHSMYDFTPDAVLMVMASTYFDPKDYIFEDYPA